MTKEEIKIEKLRLKDEYKKQDRSITIMKKKLKGNKIMLYLYDAEHCYKKKGRPEKYAPRKEQTKRISGLKYKHSDEYLANDGVRQEMNKKRKIERLIDNPMVKELISACVKQIMKSMEDKKAIDQEDLSKDLDQAVQAILDKAKNDLC